MSRIPFILCLIVILNWGCSNTNSAQSILQAMCGEWEFTGTEIIEEWKQVDANEFHVDVLSYAGREAELVQTIDFRIEHANIIYEGKILRDHNSTRPIDFRSVEIGDDHILFENQSQEFPQNIRYTLINKDKIRVKISGSQNERYREQEFVYYRAGSAHSSVQ